jgi:ABC-type transport system substrate-binding protein
VIPLLAESYSASPDNTAFTFKLRSNVKFHNGKTMTADDVVASIARVRDIVACCKSTRPNSGARPNWSGLESLLSNTSTRDAIIDPFDTAIVRPCPA